MNVWGHEPVASVGSLLFRNNTNVHVFFNGAFIFPSDVLIFSWAFMDDAYLPSCKLLVDALGRREKKTHEVFGLLRGMAVICM